LTPTPSPTESGRGDGARPLAITVDSAGESTVMIAYPDAPNSSAAAGLVPRAVSVGVDGQVAVGLGDVDGDGASELIVWRTESQGSGEGNVLSVYRLAPDLDPQEVAQATLPGPPGVPGDAKILVGDVAPDLPGNEIVASGKDLVGGEARLCVLGGMANGQVQLIADFEPLLRAAGRDPFTVAVGDVLPESGRPGQEIIVGGRAGRVYVFGLDHGQPRLVSAIRAFAESPGSSARRLAVGDLLPDRAGEEIAVGDDGTLGDGMVRIFDASSRTELLEFAAFPAAEVPEGVELWIGDVVPDSPGSELIVGQGSAGGELRVFSLASGVPRHLLDVPGAQQRATSLQDHVALGHFFPGRPGVDLAVGQHDATLPVQMFSLSAESGYLESQVSLSDETGTINAIVGAQ